MKRTRLLRKTALRRAKYLTSSRKTKQQLRQGDELWLRFVRSLPCCICAAPPPSHPHHSTGAGMGMKARDRETMPLCFRHHRDFHDARGVFEHWTREERRVWQKAEVALVLAVALIHPAAPS